MGERNGTSFLTGRSFSDFNNRVHSGDGLSCKNAGRSAGNARLLICVGEATARFWVERLERSTMPEDIGEEALSIVRRFRGWVTLHRFFKVATGGSTGVICIAIRSCVA